MMLKAAVLCSRALDLETTIIKHALAGDLHVQMASLPTKVPLSGDSLAGAIERTPSVLEVSDILELWGECILAMAIHNALRCSDES